MDSLRPGALPTLLATVVLALAGAGSAHAAEVVATVAPAVVSGSPPYTVNYSFELHTLDAAEQPILTVDGPELATATLAGPGSIAGQSFDSSSQVRSCPGGRGSVTSKVDYTTRFALTLPPQSVNTLVVSTTRHAPLGLDELFGYSFALGADFASMQPVTPPELQLNVPRSVSLSIAARPESVRRGHVVLLTGHTTPLLAGKRLALRYTARWPATWRRLALVRVRGDGSFAYRWRVRSAGSYTVQPDYTTHDVRFESSAPACGATFKVR
jgi:hypothetical protein